MDNRESLLRVILKKNDTNKIHVKGISMLPTLKEGDCVNVRKEETYKVGDIIVYFYKEEGLLIHRIVGQKGPDKYLCRGDNSRRLEHVQYDNVVGKVYEVEYAD